MATAQQPPGGAMGNFFRPATRKKARARIAIDGPSGAGKTFTALRLGFGLVGLGLAERVAVINTESGAVEKYKGLAPDGIPWEFDVGEMVDNAPSSYTQAIQAAGREKFDVLIIDSFSHAWAGEGGALEIKDKKGGNQYTAWRDVTPMHNRMIEAVLRSPCHIIATLRSKTEYVLEPDGQGKMVPRKVGMAPIQRPGFEYEFDLYASMDWSHTLTVTKSRCPALDGQIIVKPTAEFIRPMAEWLVDGADVPDDYFAVTTDDLRTAVSIGSPAAGMAKKELRRQAATAQAASMQPLASGNSGGNGNPQSAGSPLPPGKQTAVDEIRRHAKQAFATAPEAKAFLVEQCGLDAANWSNLTPETARVAIDRLKAKAAEKDKYRQSMSDRCSVDHVRQVNDWFTKLKASPQKIETTLKKRGVANLDELTIQQAEELIVILQHTFNEREIAANLEQKGGPTTQQPDNPKVDDDGSPKN